MRYFTVYEPEGDWIISEYEIILIKWLWWSQEVFKKRPDNTFKIIPDKCIEDFCTTHWAVEIK